MPIAAVLDANILLPAPLRDTLLRAAEKRLYRPHWSADILLEVERNLISVWEIADAQAQRVVETMSEAFPSAVVEEYQGIIDRMPNHPKDRRFAQFAIAGGVVVDDEQWIFLPL